jgi:predicted nucleic acid-binding protein
LVPRIVLLDTGPLVALLCAREGRHAWTVEQFSRIEAPLLTCEPVLAEADHLVRRAGQSGSVVIELVRRGVLKIGLDIEEESGAIERIQTKYRDRPASLADACLVRMTEIHDGSVVMTFDGDFRVYRRHSRRAIPLLIPED